MKAAIKIAALIKVLTLCYSPLFGMFGQESTISMVFPALPPVSALSLFLMQSQPDFTLG